MSQQAIDISFQGAPRERAAPKSASFVSHAKLISGLTLISRILGQARESVVAKYFGAGVVSQAFTVAFRTPNLFRKLLGEGALSAAFIPLYAQVLKTGDEQAANQFAADSVNLLLTILLALTFVGEAVLLAILHFVSLRPDCVLVVHFTQIMLPYVVLVCGTAFLGGVLQVHKRFAAPALTPVVLNVVHIAVIIIGARLLFSHASAAARDAQQIRLAYWLCFFVLVAGVLQIAILIPGLRAVHFRPIWRASFWTPLVRKMLRLSIPAALSAGVLQISVILDTTITLWLTQTPTGRGMVHVLGWTTPAPLAVGAAARLYWAQMLYQFPLGVFAIAVATAIFPNLSADAQDRDLEKFSRVLRQGIIFTLLEGIGASVGLILVRYPAIRVLFERGSFTPTDTHWMALSVSFYAAAIWAFSLQQILNRGYYALHDTMTPLVMSTVTILVNTLVEVPLAFTHLGEAGIAVGTLASFAVQAVVMLIILDRRVSGLELKKIALSSAKMILAAAVMAAACIAVERLPAYPHGKDFWASLTQLCILIPAGGAIYVGVCWTLGLRRGRLG
jgi:putative peptidoglycan lipid II flippase